jgi:S-adenosylmethionine uptake transporter
MRAAAKPSSANSLWMIGACLCFVAVGACVKYAAPFYSFFEMAAYRGAIGMVFTAIIAARLGGTLKTALPAGHVWRGVVGVVALLLWFYSLTGLPLAASMTLNYTSPIFLAAILAIAGFLGTAHNKPHPGLSAAIALSFVGVALLLKPTITQDQWVYGIAGLLSGIISAFAYLQVQQLGRAGEPEYRVVFYFAVTGLIAGAAGALLTTGLHAHTGVGVAWLLAIGILANAGQLMMTRAYTLGNTLVTANLQYSGVLISSAIGYFAFGETLDAWGWAGATLIVASGVFAIFIKASPRADTLSTH